jgi:hypothetical protein
MKGETFFDFNEEKLQMDSEINDLLNKNKKNLANIQGDYKEMSKAAGEAMVHIRKVKKPATKVARPYDYEDKSET